MSIRLTKKSLDNRPRRSVNTPRLASGPVPALTPSTRRPPTSTVISGAESVRSWARSTRSSSAGRSISRARWLRNPSDRGSSTAKDSASVIAAVASVRPGVNGTTTSCPASRAASSTAAEPPSTIRSASDTFVPSVWAALNSCWIASSRVSTAARASGRFTSHPFCGSSRMRAPLAPPRLSLPRKVEAEAQAVETRSGTDRPEPSSFALRAATSRGSTSG